MTKMFRSTMFWLPFLASLLITGAFFGWELGLLNTVFRSLPRPPATEADILFTVLLGLMLSFTSGLVAWTSKMGSCPLSVKSATGIAGVLGAITLICPVCIVLPASLLGLGFLLTFLAPFIPLLRLIAIVLLAVCIWMLMPKKNR